MPNGTRLLLSLLFLYCFLNLPKITQLATSSRIAGPFLPNDTIHSPCVPVDLPLSCHRSTPTYITYNPHFVPLYLPACLLLSSQALLVPPCVYEPQGGEELRFSLAQVDPTATTTSTTIATKNRPFWIFASCLLPSQGFSPLSLLLSRFATSLGDEIHNTSLCHKDTRTGVRTVCQECVTLINSSSA